MTLKDDVATAVARLRRERSLGMSEAVNELVRAGLSAPPKAREPFVQRTFPVGLRVDVTNVWDAIETLDGPDAP